MTLRFDALGRPCGLDWATVSASCPQDPSVWSDASVVKPKRSDARLPDETETEIVRLYVEGTSVAETCRQTEVHALTVSRVLDRNGIERRTRPRGGGEQQRTPEHVIDEIVRLYVEEGLTGYQVGDRVGVRHATVFKHLRRRGIQPRAKGHRTKTSAA